MNFNESFDICSNHVKHNGFSQCQCALSIASRLKRFVDDNLDLMHIILNTIKIEKLCLESKKENSVKSPEVCKNYIFVDFLGFDLYTFDDTPPIYKEFCLIDGDFEYHKIIKPPFNSINIEKPLREIISWDTFTMNGLTFDCGNISFIDVLACTHKRLNNRTIVVANEDKAHLLKKMFRDYCNFECISFDWLGFELDHHERPKICHNHEAHNAYSHCECALSMASHLKKIIESNLTTMDILESTLNIKQICQWHLRA